MTDENHDFESLLDYLKRNRGFDFTSYKRTSLTRRVRKQMESVGVDRFADYIDYLEVHPDEFAALFNTVLINVTSFFRDPEAWDALRTEVLPPIAEKSGQIRVWTAGCATGQETYTAAMVLAEILGENRFREQVKIYATDADNEALSQARQAAYSTGELEDVPPDLRAKYFEPSNGRFSFRTDLRRAIIFGAHDLLQDAPISRLDLLICRNTLIYFNSEAQSRIMARFHFALNEDGHLFLGRSELLLTHARLFTPLNVRARIFKKVARVNMRERLLVLAESGNDAGRLLGEQGTMREEGFDSSPLAQIVIDRDSTLALANAQARQLFRLTIQDLGRPIQELELSYRPTELRSRIEQVYATNSAVLEPGVEFRSGGEVKYFDILFTPIGANGDWAGVNIAFTDVTAVRRLKAELERSAHDLETAYEELQATNEELETTNEELQSTIEELETTNEELQSTNEELETMNEELQSTNEELETINEELRRRTDELNSVNAYMDSILASLRDGVVVVDKNQNIRLWNTRAEDLWGLRYDEVVGRSLFGLDIGLPVEQLRKPLKTVAEEDGGHGEVIVPAVNRRGRNIDLRINLTRLVSTEKTPMGIIMFMEEMASDKKA